MPPHRLTTSHLGIARKPERGDADNPKFSHCVLNDSLAFFQINLKKCSFSQLSANLVSNNPFHARAFSFEFHDVFRLYQSELPAWSRPSMRELGDFLLFRIFTVRRQITFLRFSFLPRGKWSFFTGSRCRPRHNAGSRASGIHHQRGLGPIYSHFLH